ncbi:MAG TPA: M50 family metallopeptidase [Candidatus Dormibacteraeota bacterium]|nr:M50 family metallopeptidase [Candidatus Dormibacteraeota bacterium]
MTAVVQGVVGVVLFLVIIGARVLVHEVGHFVAARRAGVRVQEFGIGMPPRALVLRSVGETLYTLNWLPIGGFVKLEGEDGDSNDPRSFGHAPLLVRLAILVAGVVMNLLLALGLMLVVAGLPQQEIAVQIGGVQAGSPAAAAGLTAGMRIVSVDGRRYDRIDQPIAIVDDLRARAGRQVTLGLVDVSGAPLTVTTTLRSPDQLSKDKGALGVTDLKAVVLDQTFTRTPTDALATGLNRTVGAFRLILDGLGQVASAIATRPTSAPPVAGPVGIAQEVSVVFWQAGPVAPLYVVALLSANLALVNILPFPPLDGGRMLMLLIKAVVGKRVSVRAEQLTYVVGFAFLLTFLLWVTVFDVARLFNGTVP